MDFFARQDQVRRRGIGLVLAFGLAVCMTVFAIDLVVAWLFHLWQWLHASHPASMGASGYVKTSLVAVLVIGAAALWRMRRLRGSGADMAGDMGATLVPVDTNRPDWRILRNVIEEIAIASGMPVPDILVMEDEVCINAFTAGHTASDAAICVTGGCLELLDRDELQGLVAHQFSHILHGEMRLNIRMTGLLFGIHGVSVLGKRALLAGVPGFLVGLPIMVAGSVGSFFARLVQAAVVRSQVALSDAAAVQFTRQASGIVGALKKIVAFQHGSMLVAYNRDEVAHMAFGDPTQSWLFRIHPPIRERVRALGRGWSDIEIRRMHDGWRDWKGVSERRIGSDDTPWTAACTVIDQVAAVPHPAGMLEPALAARAEDVSSDAPGAGEDLAPMPPGRVHATPAPVAVASESHAASPGVRVGQVKSADIDKAVQVRDRIPSYLRDAVRNPILAAGVILALVLDEKSDLRRRQVAQVEQLLGKQMALSVDNMQHMLAKLSPMQRLPLANLAFPALRRHPTLDIRQLMVALGRLVHMDQCVNVHEYCLQHLLHRQLEDLVRPARRRPMVRKRLDQCRGTVAMLCAIVAHQAGDAGTARQACRQALARIFPGWEHDCVLPEDWQGALNGVLIGLAGLAGADKRRLVDALATAVRADGVIRVEEAELLRVICADLDCPLPLSGIEPAPSA